MTPAKPPRSSARLSVPAFLIDGRGHASEHYILRVVGDAMMKEGIVDGDFLIILRLDRPEAGDLIVALVGDDAMVRRFHPEPEGMVRLDPASSSFHSIRVPAATLQIQGIVVGLMRRFRGAP